MEQLGDGSGQIVIAKSYFTQNINSFIIIPNRLGPLKLFLLTFVASCAYCLNETGPSRLRAISTWRRFSNLPLAVIEIFMIREKILKAGKRDLH